LFQAFLEKATFFILQPASARAWIISTYFFSLVFQYHIVIAWLIEPISWNCNRINIYFILMFKKHLLEKSQISYQNVVIDRIAKNLKHDSAQKARDARREIFREWDILIVRRSEWKIEATPQIGFFQRNHYLLPIRLSGSMNGYIKIRRDP
jgi:hypothetical protein